MSLRIVSLFSGYGSQELALKYNGIEYTAVANCEILQIANKVYDTLHKTENGNLGDIKQIDEKNFPKCDLLTYSFPCQDISIAGKQKGIQVGTRSGLLYEVERIIKHNKPKYLLMENVKNLVSHNHINQFNNYIKELENIGYGNHWMILNAADFGCAQNRERCFMVSILNESNETVKEKMEKVLLEKIPRIPMKSILEEIPSDSNLWKDYQYELNNSKMNSVCLLVARRTDIKYDQARRIYSPEKCSPCLTTVGSPQIMIGDKIRLLSPRECYRLMGVKDFDIDKVLSSNLSNKSHYFLTGNSICIPVMQAIFKHVF
jgi:DNA (cytosine-5)-methyltransferase 1